MNSNYLKVLGINSAQEEAAIRISQRIRDCDYMHTYNILCIYGYGACIWDPFHDLTGSIRINPIEEFGESFLDSEWVSLAQGLCLDDTSTEEDINMVVQLEIEKIYTLIRNKIKNTYALKLEGELSKLRENFNC